MIEELFLHLPDWAKEQVINFRNLYRSIPYRGEGRWCPVCEKESRNFGEFGVVPRVDAKCMRCGALERHRFVWLYLCGLTNLFNGNPKMMLHVAPEPCFEFKLRKRLGQGYITADLMNRRAMVKMDITKIQYPDNYFDVIYCSHVLEHVEDDKKAMREFFRVMKQDGWAILLVPITSDKTVEDASIVDPSERLKIFGQEDHVRRYGADFVDRLREAGFEVKVSSVIDLFETNDIVRMGLTPASGHIHYCYKNRLHKKVWIK